MTLETTNFSLNDKEFLKIKNLSNQLESEVLILFWQFTILFLKEIDTVSNQHLSIEMFLIRLIHLASAKVSNKNKVKIKEDSAISKTEFSISSKAINQIKNISQEEKIKPEIQKEIKLKYELEKNVNLVKFEKNRIEISFNDSLDKDFVKDLSSKLFEWTGERWLITFSKSKGKMSVKDKEISFKKALIDDAKKSEIFKTVINNFSDAELIDVKIKNKGEDND